MDTWRENEKITRRAVAIVTQKQIYAKAGPPPNGRNGSTAYLGAEALLETQIAELSMP